MGGMTNNGDTGKDQGLPTLVIPNHTWRWFNPQGGQPISTDTIQLMGPASDLTPVALIHRNTDGTWHASGTVHGMSGFIAGSWHNSLTIAECADAIAAHVAPPVVKPQSPLYQLTVTPPVWNGKRGGWVMGDPVTTTYSTEEALRSALLAHGVPATVIRDSSSYRDASWGPVTPVKLNSGVARLALAIYREMTASYAAYLESCEEDRRRGYAAHYCEHGTNRWTDYDNICGGCEDGYSLRTPTLRRREALRVAKDRHREAKDMLAWAWQANHHGMASDAFVVATMARYESLMGVA